MVIKEFKNSELIYPNQIDGTDKWFYGILYDIYDPDDMLEDDCETEGTRIIFYNSNGEAFEPIKQQHNVILSEPCYNIDDDAFSVISYDFDNRVIKLLKYDHMQNSVEILFEMPLSEGGVLSDLRMLDNTYALLQYDCHEDKITIFYPYKCSIELEEHESIVTVNNNHYICQKWFDVPGYHEEIIIRSVETGEIIERKEGCVAIMPMGELWLMTK